MSFPMYTPTHRVRQWRNETACWWKDLVYAETLLGVAQIIRDPSIDPTTTPSINDRYLGLPTPYGAFDVCDNPIRLPKLTAFEDKMLEHA